jgi:hypothetical protein
MGIQFAQVTRHKSVMPLKTIWVVQDNLHPTGEANTLDLLARACEEADRSLVRVKVIPFSTEMPDIQGVVAPFVLYGYTTLITNAARSPLWSSGVFYDPELFHPSIYAERYGDFYLNADTRVFTHEQFRSETHPQEARFFMRPDDDLKQWPGQVMTFAEYSAWYDNFDDEMRNTAVAISSPKHIDAEWRVVLVDGQPVASSQYQPQPTSWVPVEVEEFSRTMAARWSPVPVFVMDVASVDGELKVIELNCFNGSSFYLADLHRIVRNVSLFLESITPPSESESQKRNAT